MSSHIDAANRMRPIVAPTAQNGLLVQTQIMTDKLNTLRQDWIGRTIGTLDPETLERLDVALLLVLGLAR
jgi:mRNA-degrading endonuclease toxin of MazEF toxin-antitoxin module